MLQPNDYPIRMTLDARTGVLDPCEEQVLRRISDLKMMFKDTDAVNQMIREGDPVVYQIHYYHFLTSNSDMALAVTCILPGKVGNEYYMTKGHQHEVDNQPEVYHCLQGTGFLLLDTLEGRFEAIPWEAGVVTHIPPMWAHRVVNTGSEPLVFTGTFHVAAGHDYSVVEKIGFQKIVVEEDRKPKLIPVR